MRVMTNGHRMNNGHFTASPDAVQPRNQAWMIARFLQWAMKIKFDNPFSKRETHALSMQNWMTVDTPQSSCYHRFKLNSPVFIQSGGGKRPCEARQPAQCAKVPTPAGLRSPQDEQRRHSTGYKRSGGFLLPLKAQGICSQQAGDAAPRCATTGFIKQNVCLSSAT